jgi:hypothetical protein
MQSDLCRGYSLTPALAEAITDEEFKSIKDNKPKFSEKDFVRQVREYLEKYNIAEANAVLPEYVADALVGGVPVQKLPDGSANPEYTDWEVNRNKMHKLVRQACWPHKRKNKKDTPAILAAFTKQFPYGSRWTYKLFLPKGYVTLAEEDAATATPLKDAETL